MEARLETAERTKGVFFRNGDLGYVFGDKGLADQVAVSKENNPEWQLGFWPKQLSISE